MPQKQSPAMPSNLAPRSRSRTVGGSTELSHGNGNDEPVADSQIPRRSIILPSADRQQYIGSAPNTVNVFGRSLIPPQSSFARAIVGSTDKLHVTSNASLGMARGTATMSNNSLHPGMSGLSVLLNQQQQQQQQHEQPLLQRHTSNDFLMHQNRQQSFEHASPVACEADSASGPPPGDDGSYASPLGTSAPGHLGHGREEALRDNQSQANALGRSNVSAGVLSRQHSTGATVNFSGRKSDRVRRCLSSKELGTLAPPSGSPYAYMLHEKERLETTMRQRLQRMRETLPTTHTNIAITGFEQSGNDSSSNNSSRRAVEGANQLRNRRRAQHNKAVVDDLCSVVTDLFIAESKLLKPLQYGVPQPSEHNRDQISRCIHNFVACLPARYALGADTPSEVLLHMRLMTAARADRTRAVVHIHNMQDEDNWTRTAALASKDNHHELRLVTICCNDANGLLEYITRLLATGGSRVLDADVMLSTDGIVLDRFVVEMTGRLRLDKFADLIEAFVRGPSDHNDGLPSSESKSSSSSRGSTSSLRAEPGGPLYFRASDSPEAQTPKDIEEEIESAVPLSAVLASSGDLLMHNAPDFPKLRKRHSMPQVLVGKLPQVELSMRKDYRGRRKPSLDGGVTIICSPETIDPDLTSQQSARDKRQLINRPRNANLDGTETSPVAAFSEQSAPLDYVTISGSMPQSGVPLIPFEELMLIEALGSGRVSTIYRAAWRRANEGVQMLALKVAMINITGDTASVDELRREADIAARLYHPNIVDLVGVAADQECFCLAYDYCEGGSVLGLLSDSRRYYEYLPIALDIANGCAYLHARNVIHRDLKPSNILLTRDHRAKIADFGMSVANFGQELTAETGTYRYMAPEVIRHEPYSTNCDVYSFGVVLWQLITREIPFATMTPIQAAYAVAEGRRPAIPPDTPRRLQEIIMACWDQDQAKRPSFTYITMALADYAKMAFSPGNVGALTLQIANEMLANVEGNSTVNVDFSTPVASNTLFPESFLHPDDSFHSDVGLEIDEDG
ncbi:hypothetical protein MPSEU_000497300 [Mayamaea pseudoterrestris]|nr:hypothetical protein MPSEU_000497300 [Mayamaea pseudoterrestris]